MKRDRDKRDIVGKFTKIRKWWDQESGIEKRTERRTLYSILFSASMSVYV